MKFGGSSNILEAINSLSSDKAISRESIIAAIEAATTKVTLEHYGDHINVVSAVDRKTGDLKVYRILTVVENISDTNTEISKEMALKISPDAEIGSTIKEEMLQVHSKRGLAINMKDAILRQIKCIEKEAEYKEFKKKEGTIVACEVKQVSRMCIIVSIADRADGIILKNGMIPTERINIRDRIDAYIQEVQRNDENFQIILSRASNEFLIQLMKDEITEIAEGVIEIKAVARDPGSRAKVAVYSHDSRLDVIGVCVGQRGVRIKAITTALHGEKIDVIAWSKDTDEFIQRVMTPAKSIKIGPSENENTIEIIVPDTQVSLAIGRGGQNVRLASKIIGKDIKIITETAKQEFTIKKFNSMITNLIKAIDIEEVIAQLLVSEGFINVEAIANVSEESIASIQCFNPELAAEIHRRASEYVVGKKAKLVNFDDAILGLPNMNYDYAIILHQNKISTMYDLANLANDELSELLVDHSLDETAISDIIMAARKIAFKL